MTKPDDAQKWNNNRYAAIFQQVCMIDEMFNPTVSDRERRILLHLYNSEDDSERENEVLAAVLGITEVTGVFRYLKKLEAEGLIETTKPYKDGRIAVRIITPKGIEFVEREYLDPLADIIERTQEF